MSPLLPLSPFGPESKRKRKIARRLNIHSDDFCNADTRGESG